jgi:hypothetical protein
MGALAWVEILDARGQVRHRHRVDALPALLGRGYGCDILIDDPWSSPIHARIYRDLDGTLQVEDAGSENGLWVPGRPGRVHAVPATSAPMLRMGRTTFRVVPAEAPVPPTLAVDAEIPGPVLWERVLPASLLAAAAGAAYGIGELLADWGNHKGGEVLTDAFTLALGLAFWAGIWALITRAVSHRARFGAHLAIASAAVLVMTLFTPVGEFGAFLFPGALTADGIVVLPAIATAATLIYGHLLIASSLSKARVAMISAAVVGALLVVGLLAEDEAGEGRSVGRLDFVADLKPLRATLVPAQDTTAFFAGVAELRSKVDSLAAAKDQ